MSGRQRRRRRELERRARKAVEKMPRPRMGDDPAAYALRARRWLERTERDAAGDQDLLDEITEQTGRAMEEHVARHLRASTITTPAADDLLRKAGMTSQTIANAHLSEHRTSPNDRSCVPLGPRGEDTVVVCYSPEEARTRIWRLGEAEDDPRPDAVQQWRLGRS